MDLRDTLQSALGSTFAIERELGGGGMSRVFVARDLELGREVVIKVRPPELGAVVNTERFRREVQLAASLQHPHIVPLLSAGHAGDLLYYTMPLIEGESIRGRLSREGALPIGEAVRLLRDVADALAYAHRHGVVHRDIKPDNILLSSRHAVVTDFGVARALSAASGDNFMTTEGVALGTPAYMAPEQAMADPHMDHRADIYALGVVAYELLTGHTPFTGLSAQAMLAAQATRPAPPITEARESVPPALAALIMRCLEKHPADRSSSAEELLQQLETMATPSGGTEPTRALTVRRSGGRTRRLAAAAALAVVALAVAAAAVLRMHSGRDTTLDQNLVAVAPFDALGAELNLWREGFVDLLSRDLDGAGPLTTVSPTLVIRRWSGRPDKASAAALGRRTGAGLVVFGSLVASGRDSVRLGATILDVIHGTQVGEVQLRGDTRDMDQVADSLGVAVLRELGRSRPMGAVRLTSLSGASLPALKAFLQGEQYYRRSAWDSAAARYEAALALDSTLVPALRHLAQSKWWSDGTDYQDLMRRAGAMNHGLAPRESLLVAADSISAALSDTLAGSVWRPLVRRYVGSLEEASRKYASDPEIWYMLGEARFHAGWWVGVTEDQARDAFDRAIALDSAFAPAYVHQTGLGLWRDGVAGWDRYARPFLARSQAGQETEAVQLLSKVLHVPPQDTSTIDSLFASATLHELRQASYYLNHLPDSAELGIRAARAKVDYVARPGESEQDPDIRREFLAGYLAHRGHLAEASELFRKKDDLKLFTSMYGEMALLAGPSADSAKATLRRWLQDPPRRGPPEREGAGLRALHFGLPWWAAQRDTAALRQLAARADSMERAFSSPASRDFAAYSGEAARAYAALARLDTTGAMTRFAALPHDVYWGVLDRLVESQLLAARGRDREAGTILNRGLPSFWVSPLRVMWSLERARVAERLGERTKAADGYAYVVNAWRHADPALEPYVREARGGLQRLTTEAK